MMQRRAITSKLKEASHSTNVTQIQDGEQGGGTRGGGDEGRGETGSVHGKDWQEIRTTSNDEWNSKI